MLVPVLIKMAVYQSGVLCLFLQFLLALCVWRPVCKPNTYPVIRTLLIIWAHLDNPGKSSVFEILNLFTPVKSLLLCKVIYSQISEIGNVDIYYYSAWLEKSL